MSRDGGVVNSEEDFPAIYAAMSDEEILHLAAEGGLRPEAESAFAEQLAARNISAEAVEAERQRQEHAKLQAKVGSNPFSPYRGTGLKFRGKAFLSKEDEARGIYVQTRWYVMWWLCLVPLGSYRVRAVADDPRGYEIMSRERLHWRQVWMGLGKTLFVFLLVLGPLLLVGWYLTRR
ncbi:MAG TPA: hypothetical protein VIJ79_11905 [Acidobacteriaceae bacterium]